MTAQRQYPPAQLVHEVAVLLSGKGILVEIDQEDMGKAFVGAFYLLRGLGIGPLLDPGDQSRAARQVREMLLEEETHVQTKPRRAI